MMRRLTKEVLSTNLDYISSHNSLFLFLHFLTFICLSFPYYSLDVCIFATRFFDRGDIKSVNIDIEEQIIVAEYISNIVTPVVAGFISDYAGTRYVLYAVNFLSLISQLVVFSWIQFPSVSFEYLLMGRILYVVSFEAYYVASITLLARWCIKNSFSKAVNLTLVLGEGVVYIALYTIGYYLYSNTNQSEEYFYWVILAGTIMVICSLVLTASIMKLYSKIEYDSAVNPKHLRSMWKSLQHVVSFKFSCLFLNFALISSSFNWLVQYYDSYLDNFFKDGSYLAKAQIFEGIAYSLIPIVSIILAFRLKKSKQRILYLMFGSFLMLLSNFYLCLSLSFNNALKSINWILSTMAVVLIAIGYGIHYSVVYTCVPLLKADSKNFWDRNKEIGIKFGVLRWVRSIFNFCMFLAISDFRTPFDNFWISCLFLLFGLFLYYSLILVYDKKMFASEEIQENEAILEKSNILTEENKEASHVSLHNFDLKFKLEEAKERISDDEEEEDIYGEKIDKKGRTVRENVI